VQSRGTASCSQQQHTPSHLNPLPAFIWSSFETHFNILPSTLTSPNLPSSLDYPTKILHAFLFPCAYYTPRLPHLFYCSNTIRLNKSHLSEVNTLALFNNPLSTAHFLECRIREYFRMISWRFRLPPPILTNIFVVFLSSSSWEPEWPYGAIFKNTTTAFFQILTHSVFKNGSQRCELIQPPPITTHCSAHVPQPAAQNLWSRTFMFSTGQGNTWNQ
jgi:hypothetical protein